MHSLRVSFRLFTFLSMMANSVASRQGLGGLAGGLKVKEIIRAKKPAKIINHILFSFIFNIYYEN